MMSHEIPLRLCTVRIARDGFAMLTAEDEGSIRACCRLVTKAARHS